jgi:hypothetical protein
LTGFAREAAFGMGEGCVTGNLLPLHAIVSSWSVRVPATLLGHREFLPAESRN